MQKRNLNILKIFLMTLVFSLTLCGTAFAAAIGSPLTAPEAGWQRIDNTDPNFMYTTMGGAWTTASSSSYYNNTYEYSSSSLNQIVFNFYGTELRLIGTLNASSPNGTNITIDGTSHAFSQYGTTVTKH